MKKVLSLVLTLVFAVILTACGNAGSQEQPESSVNGNAEAAVTDRGTEESEPENSNGDNENSDTAQSGSRIKTEQQDEFTGEPEKPGSQDFSGIFFPYR